MEFELEDNIYSYTLFLMSLNEEDFKRINKGFKIYAVVAVIVLTLIVQFFCLTIMVEDLNLDDFYLTDQAHYLALRYFLALFSFMLFISELDTGFQELRISSFKNVIKRKRLGCLFYIFQIATFCKIALCFYTLYVVLTVIFRSHLGDEKGVGLVLNFTAAVIIIDFDELIGKFFTTLKQKNQYEKFLTIEISPKVYEASKIYGVPVYFSSILKVLAASFSLGTLIYAVSKDF